MFFSGYGLRRLLASSLQIRERNAFDLSLRDVDFQIPFTARLR